MKPADVQVGALSMVLCFFYTLSEAIFMSFVEHFELPSLKELYLAL